MHEEFTRPFRNKQPIFAPGLRTHDLAIDQFPIVQDFRLELRDCGGDLGWHIEFLSHDLGHLGGFPWWDHVDVALQRFSLENIPLGTLDEPYSDLDQGWQIVIFEANGFVHVLENEGVDGEDPSGCTFTTWFRVPRVQYVHEWTRVIAQFNPEVTRQA